MAKLPRTNTDLSDTLHMSEGHDGVWLYDGTRGMNLSMRAKTTEEAFVEALTYYQKRLLEVERMYANLKATVDQFVGQFAEEDQHDLQ